MRANSIAILLISAAGAAGIVYFSLRGSEPDSAMRTDPASAATVGSRSGPAAAPTALNPADALAAALADPDPMQVALRIVALARTLAASDPELALAQSHLIDDADLRRFYVSAVLETVAEAGPGAFAAFLGGADLSGVSAVSGALYELTRDQPEFILSLLDRFPAATRNSLATFAVRRIAESDPLTALRVIDVIPPGMNQSGLLISSAATLAETSPDIALDWLESQSPPSPDALQGVLRGLAAVDFNRALEVFASLMTDAEAVADASAMPLVPVAVSALLSADGADAVRVLERIAASNLSESQRANAFASAASQWARNDPEAAIDWAVQNAERMEANAWGNIARNLASSDPDYAIGALDALTADQRGAWISGIVSGLARTDFDAALDFVDGQRGQAGFDAGLNAVLNAWSQIDPAAAARRLVAEGEALATPAVSATIAGAWAESDQDAAARWALELRDPRLRAEAVGAVATRWTVRDADGARDWLLGIESGPARDRGLAHFLTAHAATGVIDTGLLGAFSSDTTRQQGLVNALLQIGLREPDEARRLMNTYITDPELQRMTDSLIERSTGSRNAPRILF